MFDGALKKTGEIGVILLDACREQERVLKALEIANEAGAAHIFHAVSTAFRASPGSHKVDQWKEIFERVAPSLPDTAREATERFLADYRPTSYVEKFFRGSHQPIRLLPVRPRPQVEVRAFGIAAE